MTVRWRKKHYCKEGRIERKIVTKKRMEKEKEGMKDEIGQGEGWIGEKKKEKDGRKNKWK